MNSARPVNALWRLFVTGFCFAGFALGGTLLSAIILPVLAVLPGTRLTRRNRVRRAIGSAFGLLIRILCLTRTMYLQVSGIERLRAHPGTLILANHPTLIDVVVLLWLYPEACCVAKSTMWKSPFHWGVVRLSGYIDNGEPEALITDCTARLAAGESLLIFPEGTRTRPGQPPHFLRGAAYVALANGRPILPVIVTCDPPTLSKDAPWYCIPPRAFCMTITVLEPLALENLVAEPESTAIGARHLTRALENFFHRELTSMLAPENGIRTPNIKALALETGATPTAPTGAIN